MSDELMESDFDDIFPFHAGDGPPLPPGLLALASSIDVDHDFSSVPPGYSHRDYEFDTRVYDEADFDVRDLFEDPNEAYFAYDDSSMFADEQSAKSFEGDFPGDHHADFYGTSLTQRFLEERGDSQEFDDELHAYQKFHQSMADDVEAGKAVDILTGDDKSSLLELGSGFKLVKAGDFYQIKNQGFCLEINHWGKYAYWSWWHWHWRGNLIKRVPCNTKSERQKFWYDPHSLQIRTSQGRCLQVSRWGYRYISAWPVYHNWCYPSPWQQWTLGYKKSIVNKATGKCFDIMWGKWLIVWSCHHHRNQQFSGIKEVDKDMRYCGDALGIGHRGKTVPNSKMTASSIVLGWTTAWKARLDERWWSWPWCSQFNKPGAWIQVEFDEAKTITAIQIMAWYYYITEFKILSSSDGKDWKEWNGGRTLSGGAHCWDRVKWHLVPKIEDAKYVRLVGVESSRWPCLRFEMYGCNFRKGEDGRKGGKGDGGDRGPQGEPGDKGEQGPPGIKGPRGKTGHRGPKGKSGEVGLAGIKGIKGLRGEDGALGKQGKAGLAGEKGIKGGQGDVGLTGPAGPPGDVGLQGPKGKDQPAKGDKGPRGSKGIVGKRGRDGKNGPDGKRGPKGDHGALGVGGDKGDPGDRGDPGLPGRQGESGVKGELGPEGEEGDVEDGGQQANQDKINVLRAAIAELSKELGLLIGHAGKAMDKPPEEILAGQSSRLDMLRRTERHLMLLRRQLHFARAKRREQNAVNEGNDEEQLLFHRQVADRQVQDEREQEALAPVLEESTQPPSITVAQALGQETIPPPFFSLPPEAPPLPPPGLEPTRSPTPPPPTLPPTIPTLPPTSFSTPPPSAALPSLPPTAPLPSTAPPSASSGPETGAETSTEVVSLPPSFEGGVEGTISMQPKVRPPRPQVVLPPSQQGGAGEVSLQPKVQPPRNQNGHVGVAMTEQSDDLGGASTPMQTGGGATDTLARLRRAVSAAQG